MFVLLETVPPMPQNVPVIVIPAQVAVLPSVALLTPLSVPVTVISARVQEPHSTVQLIIPNVQIRLLHVTVRVPALRLIASLVALQAAVTKLVQVILVGYLLILQIVQQAAPVKLIVLAQGCLFLIFLLALAQLQVL